MAAVRMPRANVHKAMSHRKPYRVRALPQFDLHWLAACLGLWHGCCAPFIGGALRGDSSKRQRRLMPRGPLTMVHLLAHHRIDVARARLFAVCGSATSRCMLRRINAPIRSLSAEWLYTPRLLTWATVGQCTLRDPCMTAAGSALVFRHPRTATPPS